MNFRRHLRSGGRQRRKGRKGSPLCLIWTPSILISLRHCVDHQDYHHRKESCCHQTLFFITFFLCFPVSLSFFKHFALKLSFMDRRLRHCDINIFIERREKRSMESIRWIKGERSVCSRNREDNKYGQMGHTSVQYPGRLLLRKRRVPPRHTHFPTR